MGCCPQLFGFADGGRGPATALIERRAWKVNGHVAAGDPRRRPSRQARPVRPSLHRETRPRLSDAALAHQPSYGRQRTPLHKPLEGFQGDRVEPDHDEFLCFWRVLASQQLGISSCRHLDVAVRLLRPILNSEEVLLNLLEHCRIIVDHPAVEANLNRRIGNQQVLAFVAVEVFDSTLLTAVAATRVSLHFPHRVSLLGRQLASLCSC